MKIRGHALLGLPLAALLGMGCAALPGGERAQCPPALAPAPPQRFVLDGEGAQRSSGPTSVSVERFVHSIYLHGLPFGEARHYGPQAVPALLGMLEPTARDPFAGNAAAVPGMIGSPAQAPALIRFAARDPAQSSSQSPSGERLQAMLALGHLVQRTGSDEALRFLLDASQPAYWGPQGDAVRRQAGEDAARSARAGLAVSGHPAAHARLSALAQHARAIPRDPLALTPGPLEDLIRINDRVCRGGLAGYYGWTTP
jgi:hypothetical protein